MIFTGTQPSAYTLEIIDGSPDILRLTISGSASNNADWSALSLSNGTLTPTFAAATTSYTATVTNAITSTAVSATPDDSGASVTGVTVAANGGSATACTTPGNDCPLAVGDNVITVTVQAADGTEKSYTVTVTRAAPASLEAQNGVAATSAGVPVDIDVLSNVTFPAGATVSELTVDAPVNGTALKNLDNSVTYTPDAGFSGVDTFTYTVTADTGAQAQASIIVMVSDSAQFGPPESVTVDPTQAVTATVGGGTVTLAFPAGSYTGTLNPGDVFHIVYTEVLTPTSNIDTPPTSGGTLLSFGGKIFTLEAFVNANLLPDYSFPQPITIVIQYDESTLGGVDESTLLLYFWDENAAPPAWSTVGLTFVGRDTVNNTVTYTLAHLTEFALFGTNNVFEVRITESYAVSRVSEGVISGEGARACYWLTLSADPGGASVTVNVAPAADGQIVVNKSSVTLTTSNWDNLGYADTSNFVCVRAVDDAVVDASSTICLDGNSDLRGDGTLVVDKECGDHTTTITHTIAGASPSPATLAPNADTIMRRQADGQYAADATVPVLIQDNDSAGVIFTESFGLSDLDEDGHPVDKACYWVTLSSQPSASVTITPQADGQIVVTPASLVIDHTNWNSLGSAGNRICVTPQQDDAVEGTPDAVCADKTSDLYGVGAATEQVCGSHVGFVDHSFSSADPLYDGAGVAVTTNGADLDATARTIDVLIRDDDAAGLVFSPAALSGLEGENVRYTVRLAARPTADVIVTLGAGVQAAGAQAVALTFTPDTWNVPQGATTVLPDDQLANGTRLSTLTHAVRSDDAAYAALSTAGVTLPVTVADDDAADAHLSAGEVTLSEGGSGTYAVRLTAAPSAPVVLTVDGTAALVAAPTQLIFTAENWAQAQSVTLTAVDDAVDAGTTVTAEVRHVTASDDPGYDGRVVGTLQVAIADNDLAALVVGSPAVTTLAEGTETGYTVVLATQPAAAVQVYVVTDGLTTPNPGVLHFDASNWDQPQALRLTATEDDIDRGVSPRSSVVYHFAVSEDRAYNGLSHWGTNVLVLDNDTAGIRLSQDRVDVDAGGRVQVRVTLATEPLAEVAVLLTPTAGVVLGTTCPAATEGANHCLLFSPENWDSGQLMTVSVQDDAPAFIDLAAMSTDARYDGTMAWLYVNHAAQAPYAIFLPLVADE